MPEVERDDDLSAFVTAKAVEHHVPGLSVGVVFEGRHLVATHGVTSLTDPLPIDVDTLFLIGSTTKTLTATALMSLVDEGRLTLTDRVLDHLPDFRVSDADATATVTVGQLLNHTAGWQGDALPKTGFGDDALTLALDVVAKGPQEFPPGQHMSYNNGALIIAGQLLARLTGTDYEQAVTDRVLTPLGMTGTFFHPWDVAYRPLAVGHLPGTDSSGSTPYAGWVIGRGMSPAGGAISSLRDQLRYLDYHLTGATSGPAPLREDTRLLMQQPTVTAASTITGVGISWLLDDVGGIRLATHGGNVSNLHTSAFAMAPDHGLGITVLGNSRGATAVGRDALSWALQHYLDQPPRPPLPTHPLSTTELDSYTGLYDVGPWSWAVTIHDGQLQNKMRLPEDTSAELRALFEIPATALVCVGPDQFAPATDPVAASCDFIRDDTGTIRWFRCGMRMAPRKSDMTTPDLTPTLAGALADALAAAFAAAGVDGYLHAVDLTSGADISHQADAYVIPASTFKVPVLLELCRQAATGDIDATTPIPVPVADRSPGPNGLSVMQDPMTMSLRDLAWQMIGISDNAATDVVCAHVGLDNVNATLTALDIKDTTISGDCRDLFASIRADLGVNAIEEIPAGTLGWEHFHLASALNPDRAATRTTPRDMTRLLSLIWSDEAAPAAACAEARRILGLQVWPHRLASGFNDRDDIKTSGKTGTLPTIRNEVGVVEYPDGGRYAIAVFTRANTLNQKNPAADAVIGHTARLAVDALRHTP